MLENDYSDATSKSYSTAHGLTNIQPVQNFSSVLKAEIKHDNHSRRTDGRPMIHFRCFTSVGTELASVCVTQISTALNLSVCESRGITLER